METKLKLAKAFKKLMETKSFEDITITEITNACGLTRVAFYYHFEDKYQLLNWIFGTEIMEPFTEGISYDNWHKKLEVALVTIKGDKVFYRNAIDYDREEFTRFMSDACKEIISRVIDDMVKDEFTIDKKDKNFMEEFFAYGITGTIVHWVRQGMPDSPNKISRRLKNLVEDSKILTVKRYVKVVKGLTQCEQEKTETK